MVNIMHADFTHKKTVLHITVSVPNIPADSSEPSTMSIASVNDWNKFILLTSPNMHNGLGSVYWLHQDLIRAGIGEQGGSVTTGSLDPGNDRTRLGQGILIAAGYQFEGKPKEGEYDKITVLYQQFFNTTV